MTPAFLLYLALASSPHLAGNHATGFDTIVGGDLEAHTKFLTDPKLEGRDTPSRGLREAGYYIARQFRAAGLECAPDSLAVWKEIAAVSVPDIEGDTGEKTEAAASGTYLRPWKRTLPEPDKEGCKLALKPDGAAEVAFELDKDYLPLPGCSGAADGEVHFVGFGIVSKEESYSDLDGVKLKGKIALILEGEPRHAKRFDGPEITRAASLWEKLDALGAAGVAGVLVVQRAPEQPPGVKSKTAPTAPPLSFRHTWADWVGTAGDEKPKSPPPALVITRDCAQKILGEDVEAIGAKIDKSSRPLKQKTSGKKVGFRSATREASVCVENVIGLIPGTDATLKNEFVFLGAHHDHLGVDSRGRIGYGADDNASGTSAIIEIAQALAAAPPRRSVYLCAFAGEEDGLLGSKALAQRLPVSKDAIVAMINLDMIGRGEAAEVAVLGIVQNPKLEKVLDRAKSLKSTGVAKIVVRQGEELFQRSDHYSFHTLGVPVLFFFEGLPIDKNKDYHTWRDTIDLLDFEKMLRTTRLVYNTTWVLANDDDRPPRPHD